MASTDLPRGGEPDRNPDRELVPVTVLGGYLGAGKTTMLNRLLGGDHGRRLAVLVNDFGPINVDAGLVEAEDEQLISLENGCVCCAIADALGDGLDRVLAIEPPVDQIIIEASGVAEPAKVAAYGQGWPGCRLDGVLVAADVETIEQRAADRFVGDLVRRQLAAADLVLATKLDLVEPAAADAALGWLATTTDAPIVCSSAGTATELLLAIDAARPAFGSQVEPAGTAPPDADELFDTFTIELPPLDLSTLQAALERWGDVVVRAKGIVALDPDHDRQAGDPGDDHRRIVQLVGRRWSLEPAGKATGRLGTVVVIAPRGVTTAAALAAEFRT